MNSKQFLSQLLKPSNTVPTDSPQECIICQEEYGTRSSATDTAAEKQIRLPCNPNHTVGSNCIATWLKAHNTCPVCRHEFFPPEKKKTSDIDRERTMELFVSLLEDGDGEVGHQDGDSEDEDFADEVLETDDEDVNMSDEDEGMSGED